ncbi:unnamed protein product [Sphenostylis stenocarpa]|uniref:Uncharacterized protein n=1 Tax=Sphenostylis stenocarpa TaxID=92480 RepID=A0AA86V8G0_9FABA|nr:unnamed protein product [Sphenostylis stenocarpa]
MVSGIVLDQKFWMKYFKIVKIVDPIIHLSRIVDGDERPSIGYVYAGMQMVKNTIKEMLKRDEYIKSLEFQLQSGNDHGSPNNEDRYFKTDHDADIITHNNKGKGANNHQI